MGKIQVLERQVAERIAAGEVIERPANVVKELVENSLDAGATEVAVILEDGGKGLIEVLDNGHGMEAEDLALCVRRHATSKLRSLADLESIHTLGFRGEALPSIGAVADMDITSRPRDARDSSTAYQITGENHDPQPVTFGHFLGSSHGTRIRARGLFSQVPARLKFLKAKASEVGAVREWLERLALTHPGTGFRLVSDDRTVLDLRPQDEVQRVRAVLADGDDYPVQTEAIDDALPWLKLRAHWLQGLSSPQTRKLIQIVNRRAVRDKMLQQAILSPFGQALLPGQFPAVALFVEADPAVLDVNVHPTKTELRFLESGKVFRAVQDLIERMIARTGVTGYAAGRSQGFSGGFASAPEEGNSAIGTVTGVTAASGSFGSSVSGSELADLTSSAGSAPTGDFPSAGDSSPSWGGSPHSHSFGRSTYSSTPASGSYRPQWSAAEKPVQQRWDFSGPLAQFDPTRYCGIAFNTYLLYDLGEELGLIDQHAAHERVRYEKLRKRLLSADGAGLHPQQLLIPEAVHFPADQRSHIETQVDRLNAIGFETEIFGDESLLFRAVPAEWGSQNLRVRLKSLVEKLLASADPASQASESGTSLAFDEALFEALASEACHSAVRAGDRITREQALTLVEELSQCEHPWNCPHGRPTIARVPRARFEEWFHRRV